MAAVAKFQFSNAGIPSWIKKTSIAGHGQNVPSREERGGTDVFAGYEAANSENVPRKPKIIGRHRISSHGESSNGSKNEKPKIP